MRADKGSYGVVNMSNCNKCKYNNMDGSCEAFDNIPREFKYDVLHSEIVPEQKGNFVYFEGFWYPHDTGIIQYNE